MFFSMAWQTEKDMKDLKITDARHVIYQTDCNILLFPIDPDVHVVCFSMVICVFSLVCCWKFLRFGIVLLMFLGPVTEVEVAWQKSHETRVFIELLMKILKRSPPKNSHSIWKMLVGRLFVPFGKSYFEGRTVSFGQIISWGRVSLDYAMLSFRIKTIIQEYYQA